MKNDILASLISPLRRLNRDTIAIHYSAANLATQYYNRNLYGSVLALPSYIAERAEGEK